MTASNARCLVLGAGEMGRAHLKVLASLIPGRCAAYAPSARNREAVLACGAQFFTGALADAVRAFAPTHGIVATPVDDLHASAGLLLDAGLRTLLIEKPVALDVTAAAGLLSRARATGTRAWAGYNRRQYASVLKAREMIRASGEKISSVVFEFTEWSHVVAALESQSAHAKARWLIANSLHVVDGALHLVGLPVAGRSLVVSRGSLPWHPSASAFAGAGVTSADVAFSYCANWDAPGRWGFEWLTPSTRYIFRPIEKLHVMRRGSVAVEEVPVDDVFEREFKPGVYRQDILFLEGDPGGELATLEAAVALIDLGQRMAGYT